MPPHKLGDPDPATARWLILSGLGAFLMSLATDITEERGGSILTRLARALLNGAFAVAFAVLILRWVTLAPSELVLISAVLGSLGREFTFALLWRTYKRWRRAP